MGDNLTAVGEILVSVQARELIEGASAEALRDRHHAVQAEYKLHRDAETMALQMAWLAQIAIERIHQLEESSDGGTDRDQPDRRSCDLGPRPVRRSSGWAHVGAAGEPQTSIRPH